VVLKGEGKVELGVKVRNEMGRGGIGEGIGEFIGEEGGGIEDRVKVGEGNSEKGTEDLFEGRRKCM